MAVHTLGTVAATTLNKALTFKPGYGSGMAPADVATLALSILNDQINSHPIFPEAFSTNGLLYVPNRGILKMLPGDVVATDSQTGWPILVSKRAIAGGAWTFT